MDVLLLLRVSAAHTLLERGSINPRESTVNVIFLGLLQFYYLLTSMGGNLYYSGDFDERRWEDLEATAGGSRRFLGLVGRS